MSAPPSTRTNMRLDRNKFQRCQSALSHYRKRPPAGGSKAQMDCEPFMLTRAERPDCVAEDAVSCEPVSAPNSLLTGKLTGNFAESGPPPQFSGLINGWI